MREKGKLLSKALAEEIRLLLPPRLQLVDEWSLAYSLEQNGVSLGTLYKKSDDYRGKRGGFVLVIRDGSGGVRSPNPFCSYALLISFLRSSAHTSPTPPTPLRPSTATANASSGAHISSPAFQTSK
jgi:hypothetical protein